MGKRVLIVGGVAGGASCAARLRRLDESLELVMFEKGPYVSFANCGLPYYIGGVIKNRHELLVQTVPGMQDRFNMKIYVNTEVTAINRDAKTVSVTNLETGERHCLRLELRLYLQSAPWHACRQLARRHAA
mgnify:CR=1 FL=1